MLIYKKSLEDNKVVDKIDGNLCRGQSLAVRKAVNTYICLFYLINGNVQRI